MAQKRMLITLDEETHSIYKKFTDVSGIPSATFAAEILKDFSPRLIQVIEIIEKAKDQDSGSAEAILKKMLQTGQEELDSLKKQMVEVKKKKE